MRRKKAFLLLLAAGIIAGYLCGCATCEEGTTVEQNVEDGVISGIRTGILRQGISGQFKSFECTAERVYFMSNISGVPVLYYSTHQSDVMAPLCAVKGCAHTGDDCEARFEANGNICAFDSRLYVTAGTSLYRLNYDGTGREKVLDMLDHADGYNGIAEPKLWNGVLTYYLTECNADGEIKGEFQKYDPYYYRLDGSMNEPAPMENLIAQYNDGNAFIMRGPAQKGESSERMLYSWDPTDNTATLLLDSAALMDQFYQTSVLRDELEFWKTAGISIDENIRRYEAYAEGYWGESCAYDLRNGVICKTTYADGSTEELFDTGLSGIFHMICFPDCILLTEISNEDTVKNHTVLQKPAVYVYNWDFELLGQYRTEIALRVSPKDFICGESRDRIYLAVHCIGLPEYYLEKEELLSGQFTPHPIKYTSVDLEAKFSEIDAIIAEFEKELYQS